METTSPEKGRRLGGEHVWPIGIAVALAIVVLVNIAFIVIAVDGSDEVDAAYVAGER